MFDDLFICMTSGSDFYDPTCLSLHCICLVDFDTLLIVTNLNHFLVCSI